MNRHVTTRAVVLAVLVTAGLAGGASPAWATFSFSPAVNYPSGPGPNSVVAFDFDGDTDRDLAVTNPGASTVSVLKNTGVGVFGAPTASPTGGSAPVAVTAADIDGDSKVDLAIANSGSNSVSVLRNLGGSLAAPVTAPTGISPSAVAAADFDNDGRVDLAVSNSGSGNNVSLLRNTGSTGVISFAASGTVAAGTAPMHLVAADFDGDGKADLAVANSGSSNVTLLRNNGSMAFVPAGTPAVSPGPYSVAAGDLTNDGKPDLVVANTGNFAVLRNTSTAGTIAFTAPAFGGTGVSTARSVAIASLECDNTVPDVSFAGYASNSVSALPGNGSGGIGGGPIMAVGASPRWVAAADLNGDGTADLATANSGEDRISVVLTTCAPHPSVAEVGNVILLPASALVLGTTIALGRRRSRANSK